MLHTDEIKARRLLRTFGVMLILLFLGAGPVWAITFTFDTTINAGDTTYDNDDITVDGCTLTVNGAHPFNSLHVMNGGIVTHSLNDDTQEYTIDLTIATDVLTYEPCSTQLTQCRPNRFIPHPQFSRQLVQTDLKIVLSGLSTVGQVKQPPIRRHAGMRATLTQDVRGQRHVGRLRQHHERC